MIRLSIKDMIDHDWYCLRMTSDTGVYAEQMVNFSSFHDAIASVKSRAQSAYRQLSEKLEIKMEEVN